MNTIGISTDPTLLDVELPATLIESPSATTFLPEEDASICPLLSNANGTSTSLTLSHPLTPCIDGNTSGIICNEDSKAETSSSTGSSSGIGMDAPDNATTSLFSKHVYQHLQNNNITDQDGNGHIPSNNFNLSKDTPTFVSWNWPLIRKCTFFVFMSSLLAMCAVVVALIATLPKVCNPKTAWYRGGVFYEIFPASFQDSNNDGIGDIRGIGSRIDYLVSLGITAVRLNSIYTSPHYPDDYKNITSITEIASVLGNLSDIRQLAESLHARNISLVLDLPIYAHMQDLKNPIGEADWANNQVPNNQTQSPMTEQTISAAINKWLKFGVDGFYLKELEQVVDDNIDLSRYITTWKELVGSDRILIVSNTFLNLLEQPMRTKMLAQVDLIDVQLEVLNGTKYMEKQIKNALDSDLAPSEDGVWIHWSIGNVDTERLMRQAESSNHTLAATIMQLMLPGTPNIFYGDEIALEGASDPFNEHVQTKHLHHLTTMQWFNTTLQFTNKETLPWIPKTATFNAQNYEVVSSMVALRNRSPSIYKNSICKIDTKLPNTQIRRSHDDIVIVERVYPRRNTFVSISNFGLKRVTMDMTSMYYSGLEMLKKTSNGKIYFSNFVIGPLETIVVKLDK